jgi:hypothetical protein
MIVPNGSGNRGSTSGPATHSAVEARHITITRPTTPTSAVRA